ncbi:MAG: hypothetical protein V1678_04290 [Candidatus Aenigmatarchaeota archaeon]
MSELYGSKVGAYSSSLKSLEELQNAMSNGQVSRDGSNIIYAGKSMPLSEAVMHMRNVDEIGAFAFNKVKDASNLSKPFNP